MRAIGIWITNALNNGKLARVVKLLEAGKTRMQSDLVINPQHVLGRNVDARTGFVVMVAGVRHQSVDAIVSAGHLEDDKNRRVRSGGDLRGLVRSLGLQRSKRVRKERR